MILFTCVCLCMCTCVYVSALVSMCLHVHSCAHVCAHGGERDLCACLGTRGSSNPFSQLCLLWTAATGKPGTPHRQQGHREGKEATYSNHQGRKRERKRQEEGESERGGGGRNRPPEDRAAELGMFRVFAPLSWDHELVTLFLQGKRQLLSLLQPHLDPESQEAVAERPRDSANISKGNSRLHKCQTFRLCGRMKPLREAAQQWLSLPGTHIVT